MNKIKIKKKKKRTESLILMIPLCCPQPSEVLEAEGGLRGRVRPFLCTADPRESYSYSGETLLNPESSEVSSEGWSPTQSPWRPIWSRLGFS
jgi:hypothetical protein